MAKIITKKKIPKWDNIITAVFVLTFIAYLLSITVLRAQNVVLSKETTIIERKNNKLKNDIENLELEIHRLDNRERILNIAKEHELYVNQKNIVSVLNR